MPTIPVVNFPPPSRGRAQGRPRDLDGFQKDNYLSKAFKTTGSGFGSSEIGRGSAKTRFVLSVLSVLYCRSNHSLLGLDMTSGKAPSMLQMSKLFLNAEVREAAQNLVEEFKKAGVDLNTKVNTFNMGQLIWSHQT